MLGLRIALAMSAVCAAGQAAAAVPLLNATCPGNIDVHADAGGPVYLNGKEAKLKVVSQNYYEATRSGVTLSISINPDGSASIDGTVDKSDEGIKKFQCRYDVKGRFIDVMAMTPDGEWRIAEHLHA